MHSLVFLLEKYILDIFHHVLVIFSYNSVKKLNSDPVPKKTKKTEKNKEKERRSGEEKI